MLLKGLGLAVALGAIAASSAAMADDWVAISVSGIAMTIKDGHWSHLKQYDAVTGEQAIRTLPSGRVTFERDGETITIPGNSQISIAQERGGHYTKVTQWYGKTTVADREEARPHFGVNTPYMAAVVKGTVFTVWTKPGLSGVDVAQGRVEVRDHQSHMHVDVLPGQHASTGASQPLSVGGTGSLQPIRNAAGKIVATTTDGTTETVALPADSASGSGNAAVPAATNAANGAYFAYAGNGGTGGLGNAGKSDNGLGNGGAPGSGGAHSGGPGSSGNNGHGGPSANAGSGNSSGNGNGGNSANSGNSNGNGGNSGNGGDHGNGGSGGLSGHGYGHGHKG
jgi:hypothetical protein